MGYIFRDQAKHRVAFSHGNRIRLEILRVQIFPAVLMKRSRVNSGPLNDDSVVLRPFNPKGWIVPANSSGVFRRIALRHLVENFGIVLQGLESMCEIFRDVQHPSIFCRELRGEILA